MVKLKTRGRKKVHRRGRKKKLKELPIENIAHDGTAYFQVTGGSALKAVRAYREARHTAADEMDKFIRSMRREVQKPFKKLGIKLDDEWTWRGEPVGIRFDLKNPGNLSKEKLREAFKQCYNDAGEAYRKAWDYKMNFYGSVSGRLKFNGRTGPGRSKSKQFWSRYDAIPSHSDFIKYLDPQNETTRFGTTMGRSVMRHCTLQVLDVGNDVFVITVPINRPENYEVTLEGVTGIKRLKMSQYWRLREKVGV